MYIYCYYCIYCRCPQTYSHKGLKHISVRKCQKNVRKCQEIVRKCQSEKSRKIGKTAVKPEKSKTINGKDVDNLL